MSAVVAGGARTRLRRDDIQGLRALAVLMVVAHHAGLPLPGGFTGPDVFFTVSGFVITGMLLRERLATGGVALVPFYLRRARRLLPALALVTVVTLVLAVLVFSPIGPDAVVAGNAARAASTISANIYFLRQTGGYFQPDAQKNPFLHTWSLSVEEQFYLVFPVTLVALWAIERRMRSGGRFVTAVLSLGTLASLGLGAALSYGHLTPGWTRLATMVGSLDPVQVAFYVPATRAWEFLAGAVLALAAQRWTPGVALRRAASVAGVVLLGLTLALIHPTDVFPGVLALAPVLGTLGLLVGGLGATAAVTPRLLAAKPLVWLGDRSYSWYLWHWPLIVFARVAWPGWSWGAVAAAAASLVPAALSFQFVEEPIRHRRVWPSVAGGLAVAALSVIVPVAGSAFMIGGVERGWGDPLVAQVRRSTVPFHIDNTTGCAALAPLGDPTRPPCVWPASVSQGTMLLIGDSHAGQFSEPFIAAANALHYDAQVATMGGCPFLRRPEYGTASAPPHRTDRCREFVEGGLRAIAERPSPYAAVVVSNATLGYLDGSWARDFAADAAFSGPVTRAAEVAGWIASVERTVSALGTRSPVIVVGGVPQFYLAPQCLRPTLFDGPTPGCGVWTAEYTARWRTDVVAAERPAVEAAGATYFDAGAKLCPPEQGCSAFLDGAFLYRDGGHLSVDGAMTFEPNVHAALAAAIARPSVGAGDPP